MRVLILVGIAAAALACAPIILHPKTDKNGEYCRPMCSRLDLLPGRRECRAEGDRDYCTNQTFRAGRWLPDMKVPVGTIDQDTGLVRVDAGWERFWWADRFDNAKAKGCHLEDSCGIFPPYYIGAEYCGEPQTICPGEHWKPSK